MVSSVVARLIIITIGTLYPGYRSYKSLINADLHEAVNCLRYWIVFSIFSACETITDVVLSWFPFYYWIKIGIVLWMISPSGSKLLYKRFVQPALKEREQDIDELIEQTKQKGYTTLMKLTNQGVRYASNIVLNSAILGKEYLGEHMKRSLSTSDIDTSPTGRISIPQETLYEEDEEDVNFEVKPTSKTDQKQLLKNKTLSVGERRSRSQNEDKSVEHHQEDVKLSRTISHGVRNTNKTKTTPYSSSESAHYGTISKRAVLKKVEHPSHTPLKTVRQPIVSSSEQSFETVKFEDLEEKTS